MKPALSRWSTLRWEPIFSNFCPPSFFLKESTARSGDAAKFHDLFSRRNSYGQSFIPDILHQVGSEVKNAIVSLLLFQSPSKLGFPQIESFFRNFGSNPDWRKTVARAKREAENDSSEPEPEPESSSETDNTKKREAVAEASRLDHVSVLPPPQDLPPAPHLPLFPPLGTAPPHPAPTPFPATSGHHATISTPTHHIKTLSKQ